LLYLAVFISIAYLWRPTGHNRRLAMSDELATDEADADDFEVETLTRDRLEAEDGRDKDEERRLGGGGPGYIGLRNDSVVFDIGDDHDHDDGDGDGDDEGDSGHRRRGSDDGSAPRNRKSPPPYDSNT